MNEDDVILRCNEYLKSKSPVDFIFSGTYGLYMHGITLNRRCHDIDVRFIGMTPKEVKALKLEFNPSIDIVTDIGIEEEYDEIDFHGEKILVYTPETIVRAKKKMLYFLENVAKIKTDGRERQKEKLKKDLEYLKNTYRLE